MSDKRTANIGTQVEYKEINQAVTSTIGTNVEYKDTTNNKLVSNMGVEIEYLDQLNPKIISTFGLIVEYGPLEAFLEKISAIGLMVEYYSPTVVSTHKYGPRVQCV
jgi:hypothetical protein